jgi:EAL domain-containing protein (putative c-di-GMP-specific phosphodiesterase class I)
MVRRVIPYYCVIVAEGVETGSALEILETLGVPRRQGYFLGRPIDLRSAQDLLKKTWPPERKSA